MVVIILIFISQVSKIKSCKALAVCVWSICEIIKMHFSQFKFDQHLFLYTVVPGILYCNLAAINRRHLGGGKKKCLLQLKKNHQQ